MFDNSALIRSFHDQHVRLTIKQQQDMRTRRDANLKRLVEGLTANGKPAIAHTITQGGYAMKTMTQPPESDQASRYDIDMGVVFEEDDAKGARTTRQWVCDAIAAKATNLKNDPEMKMKCVRVIYAAGYQCDFPTFRRIQIGNSYTYEISIGEEWIGSDPAAINSWFDNEVRNRSPEESSGYQLRRITRLLKYFAKVHAHHKKRKFPAGLVATALAVECYEAVDGRDDEAFYRTLRNLKNRSASATVWANGIQVSDEKDEIRIQRLIDAAEEAVDALSPLDTWLNSPDMADAKAAWKKVFRHSFFENGKDEKSGSDGGGLLEAAAIGVALGGVAAAILTKPATAALSNTEQARRAEAAARDVEARGAQIKPWAM